MWKSIKRWWKYFAMKLHVLHEEKADPKVQIEQAIQEAKESDSPPARPGGQRHRPPEAGSGAPRQDRR